jgi:hypothetical protein
MYSVVIVTAIIAFSLGLNFHSFTIYQCYEFNYFLNTGLTHDVAENPIFV